MRPVRHRTLMQLLLIPLFLGVLYVLIVLPQQRRVRAHDAVVRSVEPGDEVMTTAGLYGRVTEVGNDTVHLEISPGTVVRIARASVGLVVDRTPAATVDSPAAAAELAAADEPDSADGAA